MSVVVTKAIITSPKYIPRHLVNPMKELRCGVCAIYNTYKFNHSNQRLSGSILSHSDIIEINQIPQASIIGYFSKVDDTILESTLDDNASEVLTPEQISKVEDDLSKW